MHDTVFPRTIAAANAVADDPAFGAVVPPLYLSTTFQALGLGQGGPYDYSRSRNPTREQLADTLARLEQGAGAVITSSGMAATNLLLDRLRSGDLVIAPHDAYWGTQRLMAARAERGHFQVLLIDQGDPEALAVALARRPALVFLETPSNPLMRIVDIARIAKASHEAGAKVAVDNTFLSPALQQPIALGADFVVHSTTKFINGHSDVVGGAVIAADAEDVADLASWSNMTGVAGSPFDAYQTLRGLRTLFARVERQQRSAQAIAAFLEAHPCVSAVHYPGLASHPNHALALAQQQGPGAMLSFELKGGRAAVDALLVTLRVFTLAVSLGGVESLVTHPASMTHTRMSSLAKAQAGVSDALLRLSIGLEDERDLAADLDMALEEARWT